MNHLLLISFYLIISFSSFAQENNLIETELTSVTAYDLSVIQVFPDSFPQVSIIFQAKNELEEPLWLLEEKDFGIRENGQECEIIDIRNISKNTP
jgi:hypothetical protein